ncbi:MULTISPECIES: NUDIX hydrolase [Nonlabens]|uniref:NUDIX hydrolase n=1 Tax=Nonlabens TaxID=363408 RepID=UPI00293BBB49|nr:NUDIX domain-containing protein [Nonlabens sp. SY33080]
MEQMYKVFVKEVPILVTSNKDNFPDYTVFKLRTVNLKKIIKRIEAGELTKVLLYSKNPNKIVKRLHKKLPVVVAGGGLVLNSLNQYLFIYRNDKWDLPKGKIDKGETIEDCAIREVQEETKVKNLKLNDYLGRTYHIYSWKSKIKLKLTHWYLMQTDSDKKLKPQKKEGIEKAVWLDKEMAQVALMNSYANIRELFPDNMLVTKRH